MNGFNCFNYELESWFLEVMRANFCFSWWWNIFASHDNDTFFCVIYEKIANINEHWSLKFIIKEIEIWFCLEIIHILMLLQEIESVGSRLKRIYVDCWRNEVGTELNHFLSKILKNEQTEKTQIAG